MKLDLAIAAAITAILLALAVQSRGEPIEVHCNGDDCQTVYPDTVTARIVIKRTANGSLSAYDPPPKAGQWLEYEDLPGEIRCVRDYAYKFEGAVGDVATFRKTARGASQCFKVEGR